MKIGITGSRHGMTDAQRHCLDECFAKLAKRLAAGEWESITIIHGDCKGVDAQADALARQHGFKTACHPGNIERWRAHTGAEELSEPAAPKIRNQRIVDDVVWLIAMPRKGSRGTWQTHGMMAKAGKSRTTIEEDGSVDTKADAAPKADDHKHTCHALGCTHHCKPEYLMCGRHWRQVPRRVQSLVYRFYQDGQCNFDPAPSKQWHVAADLAIAFVALKEKRISKEAWGKASDRMKALLQEESR